MGCFLSQSFQTLKRLLDISACQASQQQNQRIIKAVFWAYAYGAFFVLVGSQQIRKQTCDPGRKGWKWFHCSVSSVNVYALCRWRSYSNAQKFFVFHLNCTKQISEQGLLRTECIAQSFWTSPSSVLTYADSEILWGKKTAFSPGKVACFCGIGEVVLFVPLTMELLPCRLKLQTIRSIYNCCKLLLM